METIPPVSGTGLTPNNSVLSSRGGSFDEDPFLEILVNQMQNQSPLDPVDNGTFMEQIASVSQMKEARELNENLLDLLNYQGLLARLQGLSEGSSLLGKTVSYAQDDGTAAEGTAESVYVNEEGDLRVVVDGEEISMQQITGVSQGPLGV